MSKFCVSCGAVNSDAANVCSRCGKQLEGSWETPNSNDGGSTIRQKYSPKSSSLLKWVVGIVSIVIILCVVLVMLFGGNKLRGTWKGGKDGGETITFGSNEFSTTGYKNEYTGTYSTDGNQLTMKYDNGEVITFSYELVEDSLILTYSNDDSEYQKIYVKQ